MKPMRQKSIDAFSLKVQGHVEANGLPPKKDTDCWMCFAFEGVGTCDSLHLINHVKRGKIEGSLIHQALRSVHGSDEASRIFAMTLDGQKSAAPKIAIAVREYLDTIGAMTLGRKS